MAELRSAAFAGVYQSRQGDLSDITQPELYWECVIGALDDAGLTLKDVDGLIGPAPEGVGLHTVLPGGSLADRVGQESPDVQGDHRHERHRVADLLAGFAVGGEVVGAAHPVVPDPGRAGHRDVDTCRGLRFAARHSGTITGWISSISPGRWPSSPEAPAASG